MICMWPTVDTAVWFLGGCMQLTCWLDVRPNTHSCHCCVNRFLGGCMQLTCWLDVRPNTHSCHCCMNRFLAPHSLLVLEDGRLVVTPWLCGWLHARENFSAVLCLVETSFPQGLFHPNSNIRSNLGVQNTTITHQFDGKISSVWTVTGTVYCGW